MRERVASGALEVRFISSNDQLADVFSKPATRQMLDHFSTNQICYRVEVQIEGEC